MADELEPVWTGEGKGGGGGVAYIIDHGRSWAGPPCLKWRVDSQSTQYGGLGLESLDRFLRNRLSAAIAAKTYLGIDPDKHDWATFTFTIIGEVYVLAALK